MKTVANNNNIFTFIQRTIITMPTTWLQIPCPLTNKKIIFNDNSKTEIQQTSKQASYFSLFHRNDDKQSLFMVLLNNVVVVISSN